MTTEIATDIDTETMPPAELEADTNAKPKVKHLRPLQPKRDGVEKSEKPEKSDDELDDIAPERRSRGKELPKELAEVRARENATVRDIANALGTGGAFRIRVTRLEPQQVRDPVTNRMITVNGFLRNYDTPIDEEVIQNNHGGGRFELKFLTGNGKGGYTYFTQRTIDIVGDPRTDDTFRQPLANVAAPAPVAPAAASENPALVKEAFGVLKEQLEAERNRAPHHVERGPDPAMQAVIKVLQDQIAAQNAQMAELRRELSETRTQANKPAEQDPLQKKMFESLLDGDSARLTTLRENHASEVRQLKESALETERRMREQFERDKQDLKNSHQREIDLMKQSHEIALRAAEASFNTSVKILEKDNARLERDNKDLRDDVKELRAKKEKGPLDIVKEADQIKEVLGVGDGETSAIDKAIEILPGAIQAAKDYFKPQQPQQAQQGGGQQIQPIKKIVKDAAGNKYVLDAQGNLTPVKKKPPPPPQPGPNGEPPIPVIPEEKISTIITYLERAFAGGQEPEVVAQSGRSMVPPEILQAIRDHGVDGFLSKVAKLPGTSPLANQAGRNWMRKVGKELVGE